MALSAVITIELCRFLVVGHVMMAPFFCMTKHEWTLDYIDWQKVICFAVWVNLLAVKECERNVVWSYIVVTFNIIDKKKWIFIRNKKMYKEDHVTFCLFFFNLLIKSPSIKLNFLILNFMINFLFTNHFCLFVAWIVPC